MDKITLKVWQIIGRYVARSAECLQKWIAKKSKCRRHDRNSDFLSWKLKVENGKLTVGGQPWKGEIYIAVGNAHCNVWWKKIIPEVFRNEKPQGFLIIWTQSIRRCLMLNMSRPFRAHNPKLKAHSFPLSVFNFQLKN